ncbi:MAG TPA: efflux transporter outer membrane subunit [Gemmataceae bacterium]|nr:efflux transporter outer membrane subunit [Gemmataceae bacterium]
MTKRSSFEPDAHRLPRRRLSRWLALLTLFGAVVGSSGCVLTGPREWVRNGFKVGPNYGKPPAPVAAEWIQARDADVQARHLQDWWTVFQDETLNSLIRTAFEQNLNLRVLGTRVLQARAQQGISAGNLFSQTQQVQGAYLSGIFNDHRSWANVTNFNLSWEMDLWGRIRRNIETANANLDASVENYDDALVTLLADVATNYAQYRIAQQRLKIARANVKIQEDILALVEQQEKVGINKVTKLDVNQARTILEQTRATIPSLEITLGQANDTLCTLLGMPPYDLERELGSGPELGESPVPNTPTWVAAGIPADLLRRRPDVRSAERQVASQSAQIGVAEADFFPTVALNGILGYDNLSILGLSPTTGFLGYFFPTFRWKILQYGRIVNNVRSQKARMQELIATYQNRVLTAGREVQIPLRGFLRSREQAEDLARSVEAAREALRIGRDQFRVGTVPFNTVFNLETTQVQQQDQLVVSQGNIALNLINVYRALGGGWEIRYQDGGCGRPPLSGPAPEEGPPADASEQLPKPAPVPQPR